MVGKQFVVMVVGHYSNGIATKSVEKRYSDDMPVVDELPAFVLP
jgi:hypothetical protein